MVLLREKEYQVAAECFADGFLSDDAFSLVLQGREQKKQFMERYFLNYLRSCKGLSLYKYNESGGAYLCYYCWDTEFKDFDVPPPLAEMERFQHIDEMYDTGYAVLDILAVDKNCRGMGLGAEMIDFFVKESRKKGLLPLVEIFSEKHLPMYLARGFQVKHRFTYRSITTIILEHHQ